MKIFKSYHDFLGDKPIVLTIGTFDGVHFGHRKILEKIASKAKAIGGETALLTFHPHPRMVLFPNDHGLQLLTTQKEKQQLLSDIGLDHLIVHPFTTDFAKLSATEYVRDILANAIGAKIVVVGYDHHFGRNREGGFKDLVELSELYDFEVAEISAQDIDDVNVSSTKIRNALLDGNVELANQYLGYGYSLTGLVVKGRQLGRKLGYPTANISLQDDTKLIPQNGVYAVKVQVTGQTYSGLLSIGTNPTVSDTNQRTIEVHLLDFDQDLYAQIITIELTKRLRSEAKFKNTDELITAMQKDETTARALFKI